VSPRRPVPGDRYARTRPARRVRALAAAPLAAALLAVGGAGLLASCAGGGHHSPAKLSVSGAYIPQPVLADMAAGYFTVVNTGGTAARLTSVTSSAASAVALNTTAKGRMTEVPSLTVPAHGRLRLRLGGDHLMLSGLKHKPLAGQSVPLVLHFGSGRELRVRAAVKPTGYQPGQ
jgi:copper(I)-binding protein